MSRKRLFIIESPNAADLLEGRQEAATLISACRVIGYDVANFVVRSSDEFKMTCHYIAEIDTQTNKDKEPPLFIHISAHGTSRGLSFGPGLLKWEELAETFSGFCPMRFYKGPAILVLSACYARHQAITDALASQPKNGDCAPFKYVFVTNDAKIQWHDALVAWTLFYHQIDRVGLDENTAVQKALGRVAASTDVTLKYFRWDDRQKKYRPHEAKRPTE